jgi:hypothetical protein
LTFLSRQRFPFAEQNFAGYLSTMSTLDEIQEAIIKLPDEERSALSLWLESQSFPAMNSRDEELLLQSLDGAIRDLDAGKGVPMAEVRRRVTSWAAR